MKKRNAFFPFLLVVLVFVAFLIRRWNEPEPKEAFNRSPALFQFTNRALCRMDCWQISRKEVEEIMQKGVIHFNKSNKRARPCPTFALQGRTKRGAYIRVIFAQCATETSVITCYNLEKDFACHCSGDENKR